MAAELLRFLDFELDRGAYQLRHKGRNVRLERIPLDLLFLMAERRGHLVTREEILQRIWGKDVFLDTDNAINTAVRKIRRALHDDSDRPRFVITVPTKGYRFVAPMLETVPVSESAPPRPPQGVFVGRVHEIARLRGGLEEAAAGHGRLALISGVPGVGKTRLAQELAESARELGMRTMLGRCDDHDQAVPYLPFVEILESCVERTLKTEQLRTLLGGESAELACLMPKLRRLVPNLPPPLELPAEQARRHMFNSFCDFLTRIAGEQPSLLILDDLHWADDSTLSLLRHLALRLPSLPMLIVAAYRDGEIQTSDRLAKTLEDLLRTRAAIPIRLTGLGHAEVGQMLTGFSGQAPPAAVVNEIFRETEGNPFFVEELYLHLEEENRLYDAIGSFHPNLEVGDLEIPESVRLVLGRRLRRLSASTRAMLACAAAIGHSFELKVLEAAARADNMLESLDEAQKTGMIFASAESPELRFEFSHELIRQTVLSDLSAARRQQLHLDVAGTVERVYSDSTEEHAVELAHYYRLGGNINKAVSYLWRSGVQAAERYANLEAITAFSRALELLKKLPDDEHRARDELKIQTELTQSWWVVGSQSAPEARAATERSFELSERLGDSFPLYVALNTMVSTYMDRDAPKARGLAERQLALATQGGDRKQIGFAHAAAMGHVLVLQGEFVSAREHLEKGLATLGVEWRPGKRENWASWAQSPGLSLLAWDLWFLGYPDQALNHLARALNATEGDSDPYWRSSGWYYALRVYVCLRHKQTLDLAQTLVTYLKEQGLRHLGGIAPLFALWAQAYQGRAVEAVSRIDVAKAETYRKEPVVGWVSLMMADMFAKAGNAADGLTMVARALRFSGESGVLSHQAEVHRLNGELLLMRDRAKIAAAERCFRAAIEVAQKQSAKSWELRATTSLARLLRDTNRRDEARAMLAEIYNWFTEGFDTADLKDAKALLDDLSA